MARMKHRGKKKSARKGSSRLTEAKAPDGKPGSDFESKLATREDKRDEERGEKRGGKRVGKRKGSRAGKRKATRR